MKAFVAKFLDVRVGLIKGNTHYEADVIKMALPSSKHVQEHCSCLSPDAFWHLNSKERKGAHNICTHTELSVSIRICVVNPKQVMI